MLSIRTSSSGTLVSRSITLVFGDFVWIECRKRGRVRCLRTSVFSRMTSGSVASCLKAVSRLETADTIFRSPWASKAVVRAAVRTGSLSRIIMEAMLTGLLLATIIFGNRGGGILGFYCRWREGYLSRKEYFFIECTRLHLSVNRKYDAEILQHFKQKGE